MPGIMDFFTNSATPQQAAGPQPTQPVAAAAAAQGVPQAFAGTNADINVQQANAQAEANPLDPFKEVFTVDPNKAVQPADPLFKFDAEKLKQSVAAMQFAPQVSAEHMQKIMSGDAGTLVALLNQSTQAAFARAIEMTQKMVEHGVTTSQSRFETALPDKFRSLQAQEGFADDPIYSHEAMRPMVNALQAQFQAKYPNATGPQLAKMVKDYLASVAGAVKPQAPQQPQNAQQFFGQQGGQQDTNFFDFFGS